MLRLFRRSRPARPAAIPADVADEIAAMCTAHQLEALSVPARLRRDIGLDCGCDGRALQPRGTW